MNTKENTEQDSKFFDVVTLRDYFAAKAMQGLLAREHVDPNVPWTVKISYEIADAMMEARR